ncbi:MAG: carboxypeptidase regulatory-like domain-containing protein [Telluria sp.]
MKILSVVLAAILGASPVVQAQTAEAQTGAGIRYVTGGVGADERDALISARSLYNLHMTFATRASGNYRADVHVTISDPKGVTRFDAGPAGPLLYVKLPPGRYRVTATARGQAQSQSAEVPASGARELVFYWDADSPDPEH